MTEAVLLEVGSAALSLAGLAAVTFGGAWAAAWLFGPAETEETT